MNGVGLPGMVKSSVCSFAFNFGVLAVETLFAFGFDMTGELFQSQPPSVVKVETVVVGEATAGRRRWRRGRNGPFDDHFADCSLDGRRILETRNGGKVVDYVLRCWLQGNRFRLETQQECIS